MPTSPPLLRVLVVEDDAAQRTGLQQLLTGWGFSADTAEDGVEALAKMSATPPDLILSDMVMPRKGGLELLRDVRQRDDSITVVILTAQGTVDTAVEAIKLGAFDFVTKPIDPQRLRILLDQIAERHETLREVQILRRQLREHGRFGPMIGASAGMRKVYQVLEQAAPTSASVLVTGESGTGKELVAQTLHRLSPRAARPFVPLNCAAIPDSLLESELFGHEKGAFTGAIARRRGAFELADGGTLFLDEIAEMTPATQAKLLRVVQERIVRPVGSQQERSVDIRIIAATNIDPADAVRQGKLREDLYYRLNVLAVHLPPLRERMDDVPLLAQAFVTELSHLHGRRVAGLDEQALATLQQYSWPGNVRELRNVIERATIIATGQLLTPADFPALGGALPERESAGPPQLTPGMTVADAERQLIQVTLAHTGGNKTRAAELLGISLKTLHNKLRSTSAEATVDKSPAAE